MKILSTDGLTKLIQLIKSSFISVNDTVTTSTVTLADVATTGDFNDLINTSGLERTSNKVTSISSSSTNTQYPSAKCVYDALENKADTDLSNVTNAAKILMSGMGMPSNQYINLTLGASGSQYTAPANGWVVFHFGTTSNLNRAYGLQNTTTRIQNIIRNAITGVEIGMYIPVKKGDIFIAIYEENVNVVEFRFIYAQGSESEAS